MKIFLKSFAGLAAAALLFASCGNAFSPMQENTDTTKSTPSGSDTEENKAGATAAPEEPATVEVVINW